jgi:type II secretory pathway pseudopilin PulG
MTPSLRKTITPRQSAFSLVEVVLAVGVISFAFVAILGLLPAGLQQFRQAIDNSVGTEIAQRVILDCQQSDFNTLVDYAHTQALQNPNTPTYFRTPSMAATQSANGAQQGPCIRYFDEEANEIIPAARLAGNPSADPTPAELIPVIYYVNTRVSASTMVPESSSSAATAGSFDLATILVQVASNPGHQPISMNMSGTNAYTFSPPLGMAVRNYSAQIGRNF